MTTLFPKIGKPEDAIKTYAYLQECGKVEGNELELVGTVKLHGTHADIVIDWYNNMSFQSRNITDLDAYGKDNCGFPGYLRSLKAELVSLKRQYHQRFQALNPDQEISATHPLVIGGEWIGQQVQRGVGICNLSKRFVIISVCINGVWQPDDLYNDIADEANGIYHISRVPPYHETINIDDPEPTYQRLRDLTAAVEKECPFAKSFDVTGSGEGIVWKIVGHTNNPHLWFKVKGDTFQARQRRLPGELTTAQWKQAETKRLANMICSPRRLEQGLEYLSEFGKEVTPQNADLFADWVKTDGLQEEQSAILEADVSIKGVGNIVFGKAKAYYFGIVKQRKAEEAGAEAKAEAKVDEAADAVDQLSI